MVKHIILDYHRLARLDVVLVPVAKSMDLPCLQYSLLN